MRAHACWVALLLAACAPSLTLDDGGTSSSDRDGGGLDGGGSSGPDAGDPGETIPVIVAAGSNHARWVSIDQGRTWCSVRGEAPGTTDFDNPNLLRNITYANGRFVTGSATAIFVSANGYEWTDVGAPAFDQWVGQIDFGNGWWVATGGYGTAMRSRDLSAWENVSDALPGNEASRTLAFGAGTFVTARDGVGWWSSADGTGWTQLDAGGGTEVVFDGTRFVARPGYDRGHGVRLRNGWPDRIERAEDRDGAAFAAVATVEESPTRFAFGVAPAADYQRERLPASLADCLGL
ncbi:hypothetical protein [Sandaracinus amylolyticus]|uniref:hypothetical protein n=1 Tax=Sandaracinus amylolyticus TaxID=927083 RepID=UPI001F22321C|nr:hypothetical protein [Sandaracinus amylolyticus]UJR82417.1 Hypothetical protein I5071_44820 [Sandaracinus amylolyticus]